MAAAPDLIDLADTALARSDFRVLTFDFTEVTFLDSAGIGAMVTINRECHARGASFRLVGPSKRIRKTLELVGLGSWFETDEPQP